MNTDVEQKPKGCLAALFGLFRGTSETQEPLSHDDLLLLTSEPLPYRLKADLLTRAEISFYHTLKAVVGDQAVICPKMRLTDIFTIANTSDRQTHWNRIAQKHLDFLLCDPQTLRPLVGIELDDSSHSRQDRMLRDAFVDNVFHGVDLPLLHIAARRAYSSQELAAQIRPYVADAASVVSADASDASDTTATPLCPTCNVPMVVRTSTRGQFQGKQFYGCQNYPRCRATAPMAKPSSVL